MKYVDCLKVAGNYLDCLKRYVLTVPQGGYEKGVRKSLLSDLKTIIIVIDVVVMIVTTMIVITIIIIIITIAITGSTGGVTSE